MLSAHLSRRGLLTSAALTAAAAAVPARALAGPAIDPALRTRALAAFNRHRASLAATDMIGIVDFARPSRDPRFHLLDLANGQTTTLLVAHGKGSDPAHTGWLSRFSNEEGSEASSPGAYRTGGEYVGKHGRSMRLAGLDPSNSNAEPRAIVVHAAWYVSDEMARLTGKLGRSQGCFALRSADLDQVLARLGAGRLIYADKV